MTNLQRTRTFSTRPTLRSLAAALALGSALVACTGGDPDVPDTCEDVQCGDNASCDADNGACVCDAGYVDVDGDCVDTQRVDCLDESPDNATADVVQVEITWDGQAWSDPPYCEWTCDSGFGEHEGQCLSSRRVTCDDTPPENARTTDDTAQVDITWSDADGWSEPEICPWECLDAFGLVDGECIDTQLVDCVDDPPENAVTTDATAQVEIRYDAETGWTEPGLCPWECAEGFHGTDDEVCIANVSFDTCYIQWPPAVEDWIRQDVSYYGRVATSAARVGDEIPGLTAQWCYARAPLMAAFTEDDLTCEPAALNVESIDGDPEYSIEYSFEDEGEFDYVFAFSGDGGGSWTYCDTEGVVGESDPVPGAISMYGVPRNASMEMWDDGAELPLGWNRNSDLIVEREETEVRTGDYSAKLTRNSSNNGANEFYSDWARVDPEVEYLASMWFYDNDSTVRGRIIFDWYDIDGNRIGSTYYGGYTSDSEEWQQLSKDQVSPEGAHWIRFATRVYGDVGGSVYLDDIELTVVEAEEAE